MYATILNYAFFCLLAPVLIISLALFYAYRRIVEFVLRFQLKDRFVGLLDGSDCIWAVEDASSLSIINVLVVLERDQPQPGTNFLESFRSLVKRTLLDSPFEKVLYRRNKRYGYHYWERDVEGVDLNERIRWLEHEQARCDGFCDNVYGESMKRALEKKCNEPLPSDHTSSWEILIGKYCPRANFQRYRRSTERNKSPVNGAKRNRIRIPILFRVHHCLGDGNALLRLFLDTIVDKGGDHELISIEEEYGPIQEENDVRVISIPVPQWPRCGKSQNTIERDAIKEISCRSELRTTGRAEPCSHCEIGMTIRRCFDAGLKSFERSTFEDWKHEMKMVFDEIYEALNFLVKDAGCWVERAAAMTSVLITAPNCLLRQALRSMDDNALRNSELSGEKIVSYWLEDDFRNPNQQRLLTKIREIKSICGVRFAEVILAAVSSSLHKYFFHIDEMPPRSLTVVLPSAMESSEKNFVLGNNISVGLLPLCISCIDDQSQFNPLEDSRMLERLREISRLNDKLKIDPDYQINFWVIKYLAAILPEILLRPILESNSTMVFSNLPGCKEVGILGYNVKNIVFWIPNRSNTGVGCSLLSYGGYLHMSLVADKALVKDEKQFSMILSDTMYEIDKLHERLTSSCFSRKFRGNATTPTKKEIGVS